MSEKKVSSIVARAMNSLQWRRGNGNDDTHAIEIKGNKLALLQKPEIQKQDLGTGGTVWNCAIVISKYFEKLSEKENWSDKNVLEVGSGTGIVGITTALTMKPKKLLVTDIEQQLELMTTNVNNVREQINDKTELDCISIQEFDWSKDEVKLDPQPPYDIIVVSDCVWPKINNDFLINALLKVTDEKTLIIQAYEYRGESCRTTYFKKAEQFFTFERIPEEELHQQFLVDDIELYRVRRKPETKA
jgi:predicted nicotinamide N-methyase